MNKRLLPQAILSMMLAGGLLVCSCTKDILTKAEAEELAQKAWTEARVRAMEELRPMWNDSVIRCGEYAMPIDIKVYGEKPADGRSLYISMHGGGNTPTEVNDQQWENQKLLYTPSEGVYIAPRAAVDDWNMWFRPHVDTLFARIILCAVSELDVNPDKVYVMGYSAGGDGAYRMAPRMADYWAAASMMAGHPGEASPLNLRNIGFMVWMGENDAAYDRNSLAVGYGAMMDSLQASDPEGYPHKTTIVQGCGHWMNRVDTAAVEWMANYLRQPYPRRVVWRQEPTCLRDCFYNITIPREEMAEGKELRVDYEGNRILVSKSDYEMFSVYLNDNIVDLSKEVEVVLDGKSIFHGMVPRKELHIRETAAKRLDPAYVFCSRIDVNGGQAVAI